MSSHPMYLLFTNSGTAWKLTMQIDPQEVGIFGGHYGNRTLIEPMVA